MVKTTTGAVDGPDDLSPDRPPKMSGEDRQMMKTLEVDDATWGRITGQASIQSSTPSDVVRRAIEMAYGHDAPTGAVNSGERSDPRRPENPNPPRTTGTPETEPEAQTNPKPKAKKK